jgi:hypothetical protein
MARADDLVETIGMLVGHFPVRSRLGKRNERVYLESEIGTKDSMYELEEESDDFLNELIGE